MVKRVGLTVDELLGGESLSRHRERIRGVVERERRRLGAASRMPAPANLARVLDAGFGILLECHRSQKEMALVGFDGVRMTRLEEAVKALRSADVLWRLELLGRPGAAGIEGVERARETRDEVYGASVREALRAVSAARDALGHDAIGTGRLEVFDAWMERMM